MINITYQSNRFHKFLILLLFIFYVPEVYGQQKIAELGDCTLESGEHIRECIMGYRTTGTLNADSSNAILLPTWLAGTSGEMMALTKPGAMADSTKYFVILADAFGNGVSSSPSNSKLQSGDSFPTFTIRDIVDAQYRLITEKLKLNHLHAVMGISMGGMQTFEWVFRHPSFVDIAVPLLGSPRLSFYDKLLWTNELKALELASGNSNEESGTEMLDVAMIHARNLYSPQYISNLSAKEYQKYVQQMKASIGSINAYNWASQLTAMMHHDIYDQFEGDIKKAADNAKTRIMVVTSKYDHVVDPGPALTFADIYGAQKLELTNKCGHQAVICELDFVNKEVAKFLNK